MDKAVKTRVFVNLDLSEHIPQVLSSHNLSYHRFQKNSGVNSFRSFPYYTESFKPVKESLTQKAMHFIIVLKLGFASLQVLYPVLAGILKICGKAVLSLSVGNVFC